MTPLQLHVAPTLLAIDRRAEQRLHGFGDWEWLSRRLLAFYSADQQVEVNGAATTLGEIQRLNRSDVLSIPALPESDPGGVYGLVWVVDRLLGPGGCPWDQAQTHESLRRHLLEEAYELIEAIEAGDDEGMKEELGDLLLQPLMHSQMEALAGRWGIDDVAAGITEKLIRRHPHVFAEGQADTADEVLRNWDRIKKEEKGEASILAGIPKSSPALLRACEVSKRAARAGFEWPDIEAVWEKVREEEQEFREASALGDQAEMESELGDLLFTIVNIARWSQVDPEQALRRMLDRFTARFSAMERMAQSPLHELSPEAWDELWNRAKAEAGA